jgi:hypothetical protein
VWTLDPSRPRVSVPRLMDRRSRLRNPRRVRDPRVGIRIRPSVTTFGSSMEGNGRISGPGSSRSSRFAEPRRRPEWVPDNGGVPSGLRRRIRDDGHIDDRATRRAIGRPRSPRHVGRIGVKRVRIEGATPTRTQGEPSPLPVGVRVDTARHRHARIAPSPSGRLGAFDGEQPPHPRDPFEFVLDDDGFVRCRQVSPDLGYMSASSGSCRPNRDHSGPCVSKAVAKKRHSGSWIMLPSGPGAGIVHTASREAKCGSVGCGAFDRVVLRRSWPWPRRRWRRMV